MEKELIQRVSELCAQKGFNERTRNRILDYIEGYKEIFKQNSLDNETLLAQIFNNLEGDIIERNLNENSKGTIFNSGRYIIEDGIVEIEESLPERKKKVVSFHELGHVRRRHIKNGKNACDIGDGKDFTGIGVTEGMESILEEMYEKYLNGEEITDTIENQLLDGFKPVNAYIASVTYTKQLLYLFGKEMLLKYDRDPEHFLDYMRTFIEENLYCLSDKSPQGIKRSVDKGFDRVLKAIDENHFLTTGKIKSTGPESKKRIQSGKVERSILIEEQICAYMLLKMQKTIPENVDELYDRLKYITEFKTLLANPEKTDFLGYMRSIIYRVAKDTNTPEEKIIEEIKGKVNAEKSQELTPHSIRVIEFEEDMLNSLERRIAIENAIRGKSKQEAFDEIMKLPFIKDANFNELGTIYENIFYSSFEWMSLGYDEKQNFKDMLECLMEANLCGRNIENLEIKMYKIGDSSERFALEDALFAHNDMSTRILMSILGDDNSNQSTYAVIMEDGRVLDVVRKSCDYIERVGEKSALNYYRKEECIRELKDSGLNDEEISKLNLNLNRIANALQSTTGSPYLIIEENYIEGEFIGVNLQTGEMHFINANNNTCEKVSAEFTYPNDDEDWIEFNEDELKQLEDEDKDEMEID